MPIKMLNPEDPEEAMPRFQECEAPKPSFIEHYVAGYEFPFCENAGRFNKISKIGQGTFGEVFKAIDTVTNEVVALKKILMENEKEGFPMTAIREIRLLQELSHPNIVHLRDKVCTTRPAAANKFLSTCYLVFEFCDHDLAGLLSNRNVQLNMGEIKMIMKQILDGLSYIHVQNVLHRDLKSANVLITRQGVLKLADFGLARTVYPSCPDYYTNNVVTLWYRPPELLLGEQNYGPSIDMWGTGCIFMELWTRGPVMKGGTEQHQLQLIQELCGPINTIVWPKVDRFMLYQKLKLGSNRKINAPGRLRQRISMHVRDGIACELIELLLKLDPAKRLTADRALKHRYFLSAPRPISLKTLLSKYQHHMFEMNAQPHRAKSPVRPTPKPKPKPKPKPATMVGPVGLLALPVGMKTLIKQESMRSVFKPQVQHAPTPDNADTEYYDRVY